MVTQQEDHHLAEMSDLLRRKVLIKAHLEKNPNVLLFQTPSVNEYLHQFADRYASLEDRVTLESELSKLHGQSLLNSVVEEIGMCSPSAQIQQWPVMNSLYHFQFRNRYPRTPDVRYGEDYGVAIPERRMKA